MPLEFRGLRAHRVTRGVLMLTAWGLGMPGTLHALVKEVELQYARQPGTEQCPDSQAMKALVADTLGYSPWKSGASRTLQVEISATDEQLRAHVIMVDEQEGVLGQRALVSSSLDCTDLAEQLSLAISLAIDPMVHLRGLPVPHHASTTDAPRAAQNHGPALPALWASPRYFATSRWSLGVGFAPGVNAGGVVGAGIAVDRVSVAVEARADAPALLDVQGGQTGVGVTMASLVPCYHASLLRACGLASAGNAVFLDGHRLNLSSRSISLASMGARMGFNLPLYRWMFLDGCVDAHAVLNRYQVQDQPTGKVRWQGPPGALGLQLGVGGLFP